MKKSVISIIIIAAVVFSGCCAYGCVASERSASVKSETVTETEILTEAAAPAENTEPVEWAEIPETVGIRASQKLGTPSKRYQTGSRQVLFDGSEDTGYARAALYREPEVTDEEYREETSGNEYGYEEEYEDTSADAYYSGEDDAYGYDSSSEDGDEEDCGRYEEEDSSYVETEPFAGEDTIDCEDGFSDEEIGMMEAAGMRAE